MEKNIIEYFEKILLGKGGNLPINSLSGHLAELSQKERKHIKKIGGLEKLIIKYPDTLLVCEDDVYLIDREYRMKESPSAGDEGKRDGKEGVQSASQDKKSTVNLDSAKDDPCAVCSDPIEIYAIGECRHPICYRCSTKMRVLCEDKNCPVCRQTLNIVIFSKRLMPIDEHDVESYIKDRKYGIAFEDFRICEQKSALLQHVCPKCPNQIFESFSRLEAHARDKHQLYYCDICVRQLKIFTEERKTYTKAGLKEHIEAGDDAGSTRGGHPLCEFCEYHYLDNDELLRHLRLHHCSCRICDQVNEEQKNYQFYSDKNSLLDHLRENHYPCEHPGCIDLDLIPVFKDKIDFQSHNLQYHSGQKSKMEKRAEQRINVPLTYERKRSKSKRILKTEIDAAGGINITGVVARHVERMYSFIERDDAAHQFLENVFFDLEACGLEIHDDIREHFKPGDRVSGYAVPCTNPHAKSNWKAQRVEKVDENSDDGDEDELFYEVITSPATPEISQNEFPSLANSATAVTTPALPGWSKLAQSRPFVPRHPTVNVVKKKSPKREYSIGYVHKNMSDKFSFIEAEKHGGSFEDNVYFNLESYNLGSDQPCHDLRTVFSPGDKVCYMLDPGPTRDNAKAKYRAQVVWKYSNNADHIPSIDPDGFKLVSSKPSFKSIPANLEKVAIEHPYKVEVLAEKYRKKLQTKSSQLDGETKNVKPKQEFSFSARKQVDLGVVVIEDVVGDSVTESIRSRTSSKSSVDISDLKGAPSSRSAGEVILSLVKKNSSDSNQGISTNGVPRHSQLARVYNLNAASDDDVKHANSQTTDSESYSTSDDDYSENEDVVESDDNMNSDPQLQLFFDALDACISNKKLFKILKQQISVEMQKQGVKDPTQLQFLELRKEDNSAHIFFHVHKYDDARTGYAKLSGFYPLDSSWSSEMKSKRLAVRVTKEFYRITGSSHYIMVTKGKTHSRVTIHYRPTCNVGT